MSHRYHHIIKYNIHPPTYKYNVKNVISFANHLNKKGHIHKSDEFVRSLKFKLIMNQEYEFLSKVINDLM